MVSMFQSKNGFELFTYYKDKFKFFPCTKFQIKAAAYLLIVRARLKYKENARKRFKKMAR